MIADLLRALIRAADAATRAFDAVADAADDVGAAARQLGATEQRVLHAVGGVPFVARVAKEETKG